MKNIFAKRFLLGMIVMGTALTTVAMAHTVKAEEIEEETEVVQELPQEENNQENSPAEEVIYIEAPEVVVVPEEALPQIYEAQVLYIPVEVRPQAPERVSVNGIWISQTSVTFANEGDTTTITASVTPSNATNRDIRWSSDNSSVASVDNGYIRAFKPGTCTITARTDDGNYTAQCRVTVGSGNAVVAPATVVSTPSVVDSAVNSEAVNKIMNAKKNGTVTITSSSAKSFDMSVAAAMAARKDVKVECVFLFNGHAFKLTLPKGYNLAQTMNASGYVEWLTLCQFNGVGGVTVQMLN